MSLTLLHGRERIPLDIGNYQRNLLKGQKPTSATLVKERSGYYMNIQVKSEAPDPIKTDKVIGVDLGITDLAVTSEGETYSGSEVKRVRTHFVQLRASLQRNASKGTRSSRRRCRELLKRLHRSSVKDFELHNQSVIHTIYALHKWGWIRKRIPCTFFNPVDFIVFATEIIATLRFLS